MKIISYMKNVYKYFKAGGFKQNGVIYMQLTQLAKNELLNKKNILITGGSSGIGFAIAKACINAGANVVITGRNEKKLENACSKLGNKAQGYVHDISDIDVKKYNKMIELAGGRIDAIVNNAGISPDVHFGNCDLDCYDKIMDTNLKGHFFITEFFVNYWIQNNMEGNIVMVASNSGVVGLTEPYALSKKAIVSLTEGIAKKYGCNNIRCNAVAPDVTISEITEWSKSFDPRGNLACDSVKQGRVFLPDEIAEVVLFLISSESVCVNGQVIHCDNAGSLPVNTLG